VCVLVAVRARKLKYCICESFSSWEFSCCVDYKVYGSLSSMSSTFSYKKGVLILMFVSFP
jgi:hypothetical protein